MIRAGLFFLSIAPLALGCEYIAADRITGAYLAKSVPEFGQIPSDAVLAYAPGPGSKRVFRPDELNRIAARFGIPSKVSNAACFEWELHPVSEEQLLVAMRKTFDAPGLKLEIVRHSRTPAPVGEIVFPKSGLAATSFSDPGTSLFWRGSVIYAGGKKFDLWAQVRISAAMPRVIAVRTIAPGEPIQLKDVRIEIQEDSPLRINIARDLDQVRGHVPFFAIQAGQPIFRTNLAEPFDIKKGDTVEVKAVNGGATLKTEALAEASARKGDLIILKNPSSGKTFHGRVDGPGSVVVQNAGIGGKQS